MTKQQRRIKARREAVIAAVDRACIARGEAQWTNGYRAARGVSDQEDSRLFRQEMGQHVTCDEADAEVVRALASYAREIRRDKGRG